MPARPASSDDAGEPDTRARLRRLAWLLDSSIRLPGGFSIGLDGLIGLIPGVGDVVAAALSSYIIAVAARMNVPFSVLARMGLNVALELLVGSVPLFGDLFDFAFKANERNVRLLDAYFEAPRPTRARSRWQLAAILALLTLALGIAVATLIAIVRALAAAIGG